MNYGAGGTGVQFERRSCTPVRIACTPLRRSTSIIELSFSLSSATYRSGLLATIQFNAHIYRSFIYRQRHPLIYMYAGYILLHINYDAVVHRAEH
jgi:hypothetical protein